MATEFSVPIRHLGWDACYNIRDLGGYPTRSGKQTRWRSILRGDNLCRLNRKSIRSILEYGICTIIDLRSGNELTAAPHPFSRRERPENFPLYINLPVLNEQDREAMLALEKTHSGLDSYTLILERFKDHVGAVMRGIAGAQTGGILIHCHAGKDRTGIISALILSVAGVPEEVIAADYAESDQYLQPMYNQILETGPQDPEERQKAYEAMLARPEFMLSTLAYLRNRYGSVQGYLFSAGVTKANQEKIYERIVEG